MGLSIGKYMHKRAVIHADMDAFFASVELKKRPELKGSPVIVGGSGDPSKRGVVSAASYEARKFGVKSGMPLRTAKRLCPKAVFLPVDFEAYEAESEKFMDILRSYAELVESFGLDEAFVELTPVEGEDAFLKAIDAGRGIKKRVKETLGRCCSIGIGPNKLIAKMASDMKKPDGFVVVRDKDVTKVLKDMPVRKLWGVGAKTEERLIFLGIKTIGELSKAPLRHLEANFGPSFATMLHEHSLGIDFSPVVPFREPRSMSREVTFEQDTKDAHLVKETLFELAKDVSERLKSGGYGCRTVVIKLRYRDFKTITRTRTMDERTDSQNDIWTAARELLEKEDLSVEIRLVGVKLGDLEKRGGK